MHATSNATADLARELLGTLAADLGAGAVLTGEAVSSRMSGIWSKRPIAAAGIVRPKTTEEVAHVLRLCNDRGQAVVTHGGLTGLVQAGRTEAGDIALSMERMNRIETVDPMGRSACVQAGAPLQSNL